jgi:hypothetical protein
MFKDMFGDMFGDFGGDLFTKANGNRQQHASYQFSSTGGGLDFGDIFSSFGMGGMGGMSGMGGSSSTGQRPHGPRDGVGATTPTDNCTCSVMLCCARCKTFGTPDCVYCT